MRFLLDVNVLIALAFPVHSLHNAAHAWFHTKPNKLWATCPITQSGFLRVASHQMGDSRDSIRQALSGLELACQQPGHEFWPLDVDLRSLPDAQRSRLLGRNQVADMQLLMLAHRHKGTLATFDTGANALAIGTKYSQSILILQPD